MHVVWESILVHHKNPWSIKGCDAVNPFRLNESFFKSGSKTTLRRKSPQVKTSPKKQIRGRRNTWPSQFFHAPQRASSPGRQTSPVRRALNPQKPREPCLFSPGGTFPLTEPPSSATLAPAGRLLPEEGKSKGQCAPTRPLHLIPTCHGLLRNPMVERQQCIPPPPPFKIISRSAA